ncbi:hypothetical protein LXL04_032976 [Taraxacum kok-saghyz]
MCWIGKTVSTVIVKMKAVGYDDEITVEKEVISSLSMSPSQHIAILDQNRTVQMPLDLSGQSEPVQARGRSRRTPMWMKDYVRILSFI